MSAGDKAGGHRDNGDWQQGRGDARPHGAHEERLRRLQHGAQQHRGGCARAAHTGPAVGARAKPGEDMWRVTYLEVSGSDSTLQDVSFLTRTSFDVSLCQDVF